MNNNFRRFEGGISIKGIFATDPGQGQIGDIYYNTTLNALRYCYASGPLWENVSIGPGTTSNSTLNWNTGSGSWTENTTVLTDNNTINAPDNSVADSSQPADFNIHGGNKTAGTGNGGNVIVSGGTSSGGTNGVVQLAGSTLYLNIGQSGDPVGSSAAQVYYNTTTNTFRYYNGTSWAPFGSSGGGLVKVTLYDAVDTTLPTTAPVTIDGIVLSTTDTVLFSNLSSGNNQIYQASISGSTITWTPVLAFTNVAIPTASDQVIPTQGTSFAQQVGTFNGTTWTFNMYVRYFNGLNYFEQSSLNTSSLTDNTTADVFSYTALGSENMVVDYSVIRGSNKSLGTLQITSTGGAVSIVDTGTDLGSVGTSFSAYEASGTIHVQYTTTSTGLGATMQYSLKRWSDSAGGPAGFPTYSPGPTAITAAGSNTQVQINQSGVLGASSNFAFDPSSNLMTLGNSVYTILTTAVLANNQVSPATVITINASSYPHNTISYSIDRGGDTEVGRLLIACNGTSIGISDDSVYTGAGPAVVLSAVLSGGNILVQYTTDNSGFAGTMKYWINQWA